MTDLVASVAEFTAPWAHRYEDSAFLQSLVMFVHLGSLLLAGGFAIAADRAAIRAARPDGAAWRNPALEQIAAAHGPVFVGLAFALVSGVLLLAADVETFLGSPVLWIKLAVIALLLTNGALLRRAQLAASGDTVIARWDGLRNAAARSIALWFALVLVSVVMVNAPGTG
jgi:hypothetical protein